MRKNKGFTLIELLAVIVILAIIALIATPMVLKYIETTRRGAFRESVTNIEKEALNYIASKELAGEKITYPYEIDVQDLDFKGKNSDYHGRVIAYSNSLVESYIDSDVYQYNNNRDDIKDKRKDVVLKVKEGKKAVIDDKRNYVYSFYQSPQYANYRTNLTIDVLNETFEATNGGSVEFVKNTKTTYCTGSTIVLKDSNGNEIKTYKIIIFGDINGTGMINGNTTSFVKYYAEGGSTVEDEFVFASDINFDGKIDMKDVELWKNYVVRVIGFNQITRVIEKV